MTDRFYYITPETHLLLSNVNPGSITWKKLWNIFSKGNSTTCDSLLLCIVMRDPDTVMFDQGVLNKFTRFRIKRTCRFI